MWKLLLTFLLAISSCQISWATQWRGGVGEQTLLGTSQAALIGTNSFNSIVQPLDSLLATYCNEYLLYGSSSTLKVSSGSVVVSNSQGSIRLFLMDTGTTTLTSANLDTGSITANTTYYVYATAATNSATSSTYYISASNTAPSGQTYYFQIGSFSTDSSSNFTALVNNYGSTSYVGAVQTKSTGVVYQALTDGTAYGNIFSTSNHAEVDCFTDSTASPSLELMVGGGGSGGSNGNFGCSMKVKKGDNWKVGTSGTIGSSTVYWVPTSK